MREFASERPASVGPARPSPSLFRSPRLSLSLSLPPRFRFPSVTPVSFHSECRSPFSTRCSSSLSLSVFLSPSVSRPRFVSPLTGTKRRDNGKESRSSWSGVERSGAPEMNHLKLSIFERGSCTVRVRSVHVPTHHP